jgi:hypothetical protein
MTDLVVEFVPDSGKSSFWSMPECVGTFSAACSYCGTRELGETIELGTFESEDDAHGIIKRLMGERYGYNDRLRSNAAYALRAAMGDDVV